MSENRPTNVFVAFELLLEAIETEIDVVDKLGAEAFEGRDYDGVREALERAGQIKAFREKIVALCEEWETLGEGQAQGAILEEEAVTAEQGFLGRLPRGLRTPERAFYQPILHILDEFGGAAQASDVLARLEQTMEGRLREVDYQRLRSGEIRWRKTANFARDTMVKKGALPHRTSVSSTVSHTPSCKGSSSSPTCPGLPFLSLLRPLNGGLVGKTEADVR